MTWLVRASGAPIASLLLLVVSFACGGEGARNPMEHAAGRGGSAGDAGASTRGGAGSNGVSGGSSGNGQGASGAAGHGTSGSGHGGASGGVAGSSAGSAGGGGAPATPEALVPVVNGYCAAARACCSEQEATLDDCELGYGAKNDVVESLLRGAITLDPADLAACVAAYEAAAESCEANPVLEACAGIARGTIAEGEPCHLGSECAGDGANACLITAANAEVGTCAKVARGGPGDPCTFTCRLGEDCDVTVHGADSSAPSVCFESDGVYCDHELPATCQALRITGAPCDDDDQCGSQGHCDLSGSGTCQPLGKLSEPCGLCIPSLSCIEGSCRSPSFASLNTCDGYGLGPY